jgi:formate dehydrogenase major subunit
VAAAVLAGIDCRRADGSPLGACTELKDDGSTPCGCRL